MLGMDASMEEDLRWLSEGLKALLANGEITQLHIARAIGIDQGFISRAKQGRLKVTTPRTQRLMAYVNMRIADQPLPPPVADAARAFLASGGDPGLLAQTIRLLLAIRLG